MDVVATEDTVMANASRGNNDAADDERQGRDERVNLYVRGVGEGVKDTDLEALFGKYGETSEARVLQDPYTKENRGFAFIYMASNSQADAVIDALNGVEFMGKTLTVEKARRARARTPTPGVYRGAAPGDRGRGDRVRNRSRDRYSGGRDRDRRRSRSRDRDVDRRRSHRSRSRDRGGNADRDRRRSRSRDRGYDRRSQRDGDRRRSRSRDRR